MSKIVYGGGWKDQRQERLKVKAWVALFLAIFVGSVTAVLDEDSAWVVWLTVSSLGCSMVSLVLFFVERPRGVWWLGTPLGSELGKLYGAGGGVGEPSAKRRDNGSAGDR